jgi:hypothetical protein
MFLSLFFKWQALCFSTLNHFVSKQTDKRNIIVNLTARRSIETFVITFKFSQRQWIYKISWVQSPALCLMCVFWKKHIQKFWFNNTAKNTAHKNYSYSDFFPFIIRFLSFLNQKKINFMAVTRFQKNSRSNLKIIGVKRVK